MAADAIQRAIEAVFRIERPRLVATLARLTRDLDRAEDLTQDALLAALADWPRSGIPRAPGAWLTAVARRRAVDDFRRRTLLDRKHAEIALDPGHAMSEGANSVSAPDMGDELLGLIFAACHPAVSADARVALTLRLVGGLTTREIARAFLSTESTIAQRIVRAKKTISDLNLKYEVPSGPERSRRLSSVLEVIYLIFTEGYAATAGDDLVRPALCAAAQRLGRVLSALLPDQPEALGLLALMELQASRLPARTDHCGAAIPLDRQDRSRWDRLLIHRGLAALARAEALGGADGPYALQAALAACHARSAAHDDVDWMRIAHLYDRLLKALPSPVVALNRAVAYGVAFGPAAGLDLLNQLSDQPMMRNYPLFPAVRGDLLFRAGRLSEARPHFEAAARLAQNVREAEFLRQRAAICGDDHADVG